MHGVLITRDGGRVSISVDPARLTLDPRTGRLEGHVLEREMPQIARVVAEVMGALVSGR
jgi:hypothetical protein